MALGNHNQLPTSIQITGNYTNGTGSVRACPEAGIFTLPCMATLESVYVSCTAIASSTSAVLYIYACVPSGSYAAVTDASTTIVVGTLAGSAAISTAYKGYRFPKGTTFKLYDNTNNGTYYMTNARADLVFRSNAA